MVINASSFPESEGGPDTVEPFDFHIIAADGREVDADVVGLARDLNLAFLRPKNPAELGVPSAKFDRSPELTVGDEVIVVGLLAEPYAFRRVAYRAHLNGQPPGSRSMFSLDVTLPDLCGGGLVTTRVSEL